MKGVKIMACINVTPKERMIEMFGERTVKQSVNIYSLRMVKESTASYTVDNPIKSPAEAVHMMNQIFDLEHQPNELFIILCVDIKNKIAGAHVISQGTLNSSLVHPREVFKAALLNNASSIIVAHNHPSGDPAPSTEDIETTKRLMSAGTILGVAVLDHVIIGENSRYISFKEQGLI
jgi:DNA repair protein RadC